MSDGEKMIYAMAYIDKLGFMGEINAAMEASEIVNEFRELKVEVDAHCSDRQKKMYKEMIEK